MNSTIYYCLIVDCFSCIAQFLPIVLIPELTIKTHYYEEKKS